MGYSPPTKGRSTSALSAYADALEWHARVELPLDRGRTLLALGAAQRRAKRRREARETLEEALGIFERIGAALWAERARAELKRISGRAASPGALTPAEERVAALVADGKTNREVAAALFLSERTVEGHLSHVFREARRSLADASSLESWLPEQHKRSQLQTQGILPFRALLPLPSLEAGGQQGPPGAERGGAMTRKISLITAVAVVALTVAVPTAFGEGRLADSQESVVAVSPDAFERAVLAKQHDATISTYPDAHERGVAASQSEPQWLAALRIRGEGMDHLYGLGEFQTISTQSNYSDAHERGAPVTGTADVSTISSGREFEWPQIGVGFGIGIVLVLGLILGLKATRNPPLAH